jgi:hypothetical protein
LDEESAALLRSSFTGIYPLDKSPLGLHALENALNDPVKFVLKPQREGGNIHIIKVATIFTAST